MDGDQGSAPGRQCISPRLRPLVRQYVSGDVAGAQRNARQFMRGELLTRAERVAAETLELAESQNVHLDERQVRAEAYEIACQMMVSLGLAKRRPAHRARTTPRHNTTPTASGRESRRAHRSATQRKRKEQPAGGDDDPPGPPPPLVALLDLKHDASGTTARYLDDTGVPLTAWTIGPALVNAVAYDAPATRRASMEVWDAIEADLTRRAAS